MIYQIEQKLCESLQVNFTESDVDNDGDLTLEEFRAALTNPEVVQKLVMLDIPTDRLEELFEQMDDDDSGSISCFEFISGIIKLKGEARGRDLCKIHYFVKYLEDRVRLFETKVAYMHFKLERAKDSLDVCWENFEAAANNVQRRAKDRIRLEENVKRKEHLLDVGFKTDIENKTQWMNKVNFIGSRQVTPEMGHMSLLARRYRKSRTAADGKQLLSNFRSFVDGQEALQRTGSMPTVRPPEVIFSIDHEHQQTRNLLKSFQGTE